MAIFVSVVLRLLLVSFGTIVNPSTVDIYEAWIQWLIPVLPVGIAAAYFRANLFIIIVGVVLGYLATIFVGGFIYLGLLGHCQAEPCLARITLKQRVLADSLVFLIAYGCALTPIVLLTSHKRLGHL